MFGCFPSLQWLLKHVGTSFSAYFNVAPRHEAVLLTICQGNGEHGCCTELWESLVLGKEQPFITGKRWKVFFDTHKICAWCMLQIGCHKAKFKEKKPCIWLNYLCMALIITNKIQIWAFYTTPGSIWSKGIGNQLENWMYTEEGIIQYLSFGKTQSNHRGYWDALSQEPFTGGQGKCGVKEELQTASQESVWRAALPTNTNLRRAIPSVFNFDFFKYSDFLSVLACS